MKIITLNEQDFDDFASKHKYRNFYQSSKYGNLMKQFGFSIHYLGFTNNNDELIGASLLLYRKIINDYKYAYAPNGMLIDYSDYDFLKELVDRLKKLLFKQKFIFLKIDPLIHCSERNENGEIISYNPEINDLMETIQTSGFRHYGFNKFFETNKSRWNAITKLNRSNESIKEALNKQTRNKINKANKHGVIIYKASKEELPIFYEFIKKKHNRSLKYYQQFFDIFQDNIELYLAKIDPEKYVRMSKDAYEHELSINEELSEQIKINSTKTLDMKKLINKKMESDKVLSNEEINLNKATNMFQHKKNGVIIGGAIIIKYDCGINLLIEGFDEKYKNFNPNYLLKWELIKKFNNENYRFINLNAITGEFKQKNKYSGLNEMKLGFSATAIEYIGEFDLIINKPLYLIYKSKPFNAIVKNNIK